MYIVIATHHGPSHICLQTLCPQTMSPLVFCPCLSIYHPMSRGILEFFTCTFIASISASCVVLLSFIVFIIYRVLLNISLERLFLCIYLIIPYLFYVCIYDLIFLRFEFCANSHAMADCHWS